MSEKADVTAIHGGFISPEQVLEAAKKAGMNGVVVIGWLEEPDEQGNLFWVSSSYGDIEKVIYALQHANHEMLEMTR